MKRTIFAPLLALLAVALVACDDGRIYEETVYTTDGKVVKLEGTLTGLDNWPSNYRLSLAGFSADNAEYASIEKTISQSNVTNGRVSIVLSGIKEEVKTVELCTLDRLRRHIVSFKQIDVSGAGSDTIRMDVGTVDVSMFNAIQQNVFNTTCANCHGASNQAAAGLFLTEGRSYAAMVGQPSTKEEGSLIVSPGDAASSMLHKALNTNISETWRYNHASEVTSTDILLLIDSWIGNGALEN